MFPRYLAVNADEGEPCTFKDHMLIERDPHQIIEGAITAPTRSRRTTRSSTSAASSRSAPSGSGRRSRTRTRNGFLGQNILGSGFDLELIVHRGAGCYIAGDETGLLSSLEGERAMPRTKPPFPAVQGVYASPTVVNNVETMSSVPHIVRNGGAWYAGLGVNRSTGTRIFSVSGCVQRPGNYEVELGVTTFRDLIEGLAGGVGDGKKIKFFIPGGASSPWLIEEHLDDPLDMDHVQTELKTMLGSGAVMVFDETVDPLLVSWRIAKFFAHESCGKCTPCREGSGWIEKVLYRMVNGQGRPEDLDLLLNFGNNIAPGLSWPPGQTTICALGSQHRCATVSLRNYFADEIHERMRRDTEKRNAARGERGTMSTPDRIEMSQWPSDHRYLHPGRARSRRREGHDRRPGDRGAPRRAAHQRRAGARHLHPALLLPRADEAGRHVPDVPRRGRGHAWLPDLVRDARRRRHGRAHHESRR